MRYGDWGTEIVNKVWSGAGRLGVLELYIWVFMNWKT